MTTASTAAALRRLLALALVCAPLLLAGCGGDDAPQNVLRTEIPFRPDGVLDFLRPDSSVITRIAIEIAESDSAQARGLMDRRSLPARGGMLFVDQEPSMRSFWMKNTPLALDIIFVDAEGEVVNIARRTTPYSEAFIRSTDSAQFVVEVRAGFADRYGLSDSTRIRWRRQAFDAPAASN